LRRAIELSGQERGFTQDDDAPLAQAERQTLRSAGSGDSLAVHRISLGVRLSVDRCVRELQEGDTSLRPLQRSAGKRHDPRDSLKRTAATDDRVVPQQALLAAEDQSRRAVVEGVLPV